MLLSTRLHIVANFSWRWWRYFSINKQNVCLLSQFLLSRLLIIVSNGIRNNIIYLSVDMHLCSLLIFFDNVQKSNLFIWNYSGCSSALLSPSLYFPRFVTASLSFMPSFTYVFWWPFCGILLQLRYQERKLMANLLNALMIVGIFFMLPLDLFFNLSLMVVPWNFLLGS